jgi:hypothetical protein
MSFDSPGQMQAGMYVLSYILAAKETRETKRNEWHVGQQED